MKYISTIYKFKIERVIKGDVHVGEVIEFALTGGIVNGKPRIVIKEDPLSKFGEQLILFLRHVREIEHALRFVILGPWGRLIVISDKVYSLGAIYPDSKRSSLDVNVVDLEEFIKEIQENM